MIRPATTDDIPQICDIYNHYVRHTAVTFMEVPVSHEDMTHRLHEYTSSYPWLVYEGKRDGDILGYAYAGPMSSRCAYRFTAEISIYLEKDATGKGMGAELLNMLLKDLKKINIHSVIAIISLPNPGSQRLHEKFGFRKTGHLSEVGFKFDRWIDVGYWELLL